VIELSLRNRLSGFVATSSKTEAKLEAIQRWSAICRVWPWTYQKFLLCISSQGQDLYLYLHQKFSMYIYWFSSDSGYRRRRRRQRRTPQYNPADISPVRLRDDNSVKVLAMCWVLNAWKNWRKQHQSVRVCVCVTSEGVARKCWCIANDEAVVAWLTARARHGMHAVPCHLYSNIDCDANTTTRQTSCLLAS